MSKSWHLRAKPWALGALIVALILRLAWGLVIPVIPLSDSHAYDVFATNILLGNGYGWEANRLSAYWPVGTSALYAGIYSLFGHSYAAVMLTQVAEGVVIVAVAMLLARRWFDEQVALATGWLLAAWPLLIQYTTILGSELHFIVFILLAFWAAGLPDRPPLFRAVFAGVMLAAASYFRPLALIMAPILFLHEFSLVRNIRRWAVGAAVATLTMLVCILPWTARNWQVLDRVVLISTNGGANFWMGNNPNGDTGYMEPPDLGIRNEADRDSELGRQARKFIFDNPGAFLIRSAKKFVKLNDRESIGVVWNEAGIAQTFGERALVPLKLLSSMYWWAVLAAAAAGVVVCGRRFSRTQLALLPPLLVWVYFTLVHVVTVAGDRYHVPSIPFVAMLAAFGFSSFRRRP
jgi:hypothetical protein